MSPQRRGVIAVVTRDDRLLVIRRSPHVEAPRAYCFPGGGIEQGEPEQDALVREIREELGVSVRPLRRVWRSVTAWNVDLVWWHAELAPDATPRPNEAEVESFAWLTIEEILALDGLLSSNREFLAALTGGEISWSVTPSVRETPPGIVGRQSTG